MFIILKPKPIKLVMNFVWHDIIDGLERKWLKVEKTKVRGYSSLASSCDLQGA